MMLQSGGVKIWRPRQVYVGEATRDYIDVQDRREEDDSPKRNAPMHVQHGGDSRRSALATYKDEAGRVHVRSRL